MFFDKKILTLLNKADNDTQLQDDLFADYQDSLMQLALEVLKVYVSSPKIQKPAYKGIADLANVDPNAPDIELAKKLQNALYAASTTTAFKKLFEAAVDSYNTSLLDELIPQLSEGEVGEIEDYLKELQDNANANEEEYKKISTTFTPTTKAQEEAITPVEDTPVEESQPEEETPEAEVPVANVEPVSETAVVSEEPIIPTVESAKPAIEDLAAPVQPQTPTPSHDGDKGISFQR